MVRRLAGTALLLAAASLFAEEEEKYQFKILDIVYRVEDIGGRVEDLRVIENDVEVRLQLNADVMFEFDKADLMPAAEEVLQKALPYVQKQNATIRIEGHTDSKGDDDYNMRLSLKRAESVRRWFSQKGKIPEARMTAQGFGEKRPIAANTTPDGADDPAGRQRNRRVEIVISK